MRIKHNGNNYISESELAKKKNITRYALQQRRKRGKYKDNEILILKERVYYKIK